MGEVKIWRRRAGRYCVGRQLRESRKNSSRNITDVCFPLACVKSGGRKLSSATKSRTKSSPSIPCSVILKKWPLNLPHTPTGLQVLQQLQLLFRQQGEKEKPLPPFYLFVCLFCLLHCFFVLKEHLECFSHKLQCMCLHMIAQNLS